MDPRDAMDSRELETLTGAFTDQLLACLDECARGRKGLFSELEPWESAESEGWPEAARLRELALALQSLLVQQGEPNPLCDEFLDLCTVHGETHPGERRMARAFLERIERGQVGRHEGDRLPW